MKCFQWPPANGIRNSLSNTTPGTYKFRHTWFQESLPSLDISLHLTKSICNLYKQDDKNYTSFYNYYRWHKKSQTLFYACLYVTIDLYQHCKGNFLMIKSEVFAQMKAIVLDYKRLCSFLFRLEHVSYEYLLPVLWKNSNSIVKGFSPKDLCENDCDSWLYEVWSNNNQKRKRAKSSCVARHTGSF